MIRNLRLALLGSLLATASGGAQPVTSGEGLFVLDERLWVVFYDLPSRRLRAVRDAFVRREFDAAARDLRVAESHLRIEAARASTALAEPLGAAADRLAALSDAIDAPETTVLLLDSSIARTHWLLAQHYLEMAAKSRDTAEHVNAAHYLLATAHHLERTVLWSNARVDTETLDALDGMRAVSNELLTARWPAQAYRDKPIHRARSTIARLGEHLERKVYVATPVVTPDANAP